MPRRGGRRPWRDKLESALSKLAFAGRSTTSAPRNRGTSRWDENSNQHQNESQAEEEPPKMVSDSATTSQQVRIGVHGAQEEVPEQVVPRKAIQVDVEELHREVKNYGTRLALKTHRRIDQVKFEEETLELYQEMVLQTEALMEIKRHQEQADEPLTEADMREVRELEQNIDNLLLRMVTRYKPAESKSLMPRVLHSLVLALKKWITQNVDHVHSGSQPRQLRSAYEKPDHWSDNQTNSIMNWSDNYLSSIENCPCHWQKL